MNEVRIVGRSSSHFTRVVRIFAHELHVPFTFDPIFDLTSTDAAVYGENPALKMPVLHDAEGPLFGTENICRRLAAGREDVVLRSETRIVANAEELALHAMAADVTIVLTKLAERSISPKVMRGLENSLAWLDANLEKVLTALPPARALSFFEVVLYCLVAHLPFREVLDVSPYSQLAAFAERFGERESARATAYAFDVRGREDATPPAQA